MPTLETKLPKARTKDTGQVRTGDDKEQRKFPNPQADL